MRRNDVSDRVYGKFRRSVRSELRLGQYRRTRSRPDAVCQVSGRFMKVTSGIERDGVVFERDLDHDLDELPNSDHHFKQYVVMEVSVNELMIPVR